MSNGAAQAASIAAATVAALDEARLVRLRLPHARQVVTRPPARPRKILKCGNGILAKEPGARRPAREQLWPAEFEPLGFARTRGFWRQPCDSTVSAFCGVFCRLE